MPTPYQPLQALRLTTIMQQLQDTRLVPAPLRFLSRTPITPATDGEIMARFTGYVQIADLVADDAMAVTYSHGKLTFESATVPNLKVGINLTQEQLNQLLAIAGAAPVGADMVGLGTNWVMRNNDALLLGIRQRMEALIVACAIDGFSYNRLGIIMSNVTWGMPADLKVTVSVAWTDAANATPVNDIWAIKLTASTRYGKEYNRLTMSTPAFRLMIATTEFQNKARTFLAPNASYVNLSLADLDTQRKLAQNVLGMEIELYDSRYWSQNPDGTRVSAPYLPINKIIFSNTGDDNNAAVMDFANGITTESVVSGLGAAPGMIGSLGGAQRGPIAYVVPNPTLNPPTLTQWGVARGFPRKGELEATAVLTIGTITDTIPVGPPY